MFCQGVDLMYLLNDKEEKRKDQAEQMATGERNKTFLKFCLIQRKNYLYIDKNDVEQRNVQSWQEKVIHIFFILT